MVVETVDKRRSEMQIWLGVENFAKIESARVCVDQYTLFVGPNNSGKTFLMQLIQGLGSRLAALLDEKVTEGLCVERAPEYTKFILSNDTISLLVNSINGRLNEEKENIIRAVFGREIPIGKVYVDISMEENLSYEIYFSDEPDNLKKVVGKENIYILEQMIPKPSNLDIRFYLINKCNKLTKAAVTEIIGVSPYSTEIKLFRSVLDHLIGCDSLFLPASRTGLLLLYRDYFANKADDTRSFKVQNGKLMEGKESHGNLTEPIYEFLRFLQTYAEDSDSRQQYAEELQFFEEHLIEGHIRMDGQGILSYHSKSAINGVPMYLASSMINEIAPLALVLTSNISYDRLIIDEVEASLHPEKQMELVRFFNRLSNKGMKLIVSTHSDTFASKLNNLYLLSERVRDGNEEMAKRIGLEEEDLLRPENLFVYEFISQPNGKSIVKEMQGHRGTGYQFDLFTGSAMRLYDEAMKIGEIEESE